LRKRRKPAGGMIGERIMIYCERCKKLRRVTEFKKDNPILSCGHGKESKESTIKDDIESFLIQEAIQNNKPLVSITKQYIKKILQIIEECDEKLTVGRCNTCGIVSVYYDENNVARCGGDMVKNPGCGMPINLECEVYKEE
jgi:hypothetical protein